MGFRKKKFIKTAVELFTTLVHTAWDYKKIATILSLDLFGTFDRIIPERLQHMLRMRRIPKWFNQWIACFMDGSSVVNNNFIAKHQPIYIANIANNNTIWLLPILVYSQYKHVICMAKL